MVIRWFPALISVTLLACWFAACGNEDTKISCVTSFDCPGSLICEDGWCIENSGEIPDNNDTVDVDTADTDTNPGFDSIDDPDSNLQPDDDIDADNGGAADELADTATDDAEPQGDEDVPPTDDDSATDQAVDEDAVTDTVTDADIDTGPPNPGDPCSVAGDCHGGAVCAKIFTDQITSYCHLSCISPNESVCNGTAWPECTVLGSYAVCLAGASIVGNSFTAKVDEWQASNNVSLTIDGVGTLQTDCVAFLSTSSKWTVQCSKITPNGAGHIQLDAIFFWPQADHTTGVVASAEGRVYETTYDADGNITDNWIRAIFLPTDGTLTLTAAGTATGTTVSGSLNFTGNAYNAQFAP